jgi:hypothetical protein
MKASLPELLELVWAHAMPGREVCHQNEILREVRSQALPALVGGELDPPISSRRRSTVKLTKALLRTPYAVLG